MVPTNAHKYRVSQRRVQDLKILKKNKSVPAESLGTFVGYWVPQLIAVCVLYTEIKISALFE
jgi:hypothetical protein